MMTSSLLRSAGLAACFAAALFDPVAAQQVMPPTPTTRSGRLIGRVLEEASGAPIAGANVTIVGTARTTSSGVDGRYTLLDVPAGTVALSVRAIGYQPKTVTGIAVAAGSVAAHDVTLASQAVTVQGITVTAALERGSVAQAIEEQRTATNIVNSVTAEQIARSPDGDASQAVQRVAGVTVQDGRYVIVRGLGERYTTTALNGARIPSPEPERKVVPLDLFPSGLLETVSTSKTFTPDQPGDFSGAQVNLRTREFDRGRVLTWSLAAGLNSAATTRDIEVAPRSGGEWLGLGGGARRLPPVLAGAGNLAGTPQAEIPGIIASFRNVWNAEPARGLPNVSSSFSIGGEDPVFGHLMGYLGSVTYTAGTEVRSREQRALAVADGAGGTRPQNVYLGRTATASVLWGVIANLSTRFGSTTRLSFNNTYNRGGDNSAVRAAGFNEEFSRDFDITRLDYVSRSIRSSQLAGEHLLARRHTLQWAITASGVTRDEPDRSDLVYEAAIAPATGAVTRTQWFGGVKSGNRTFSSVRESGWQYDASWRWALNGPAGPLVKIGGQHRTTDRAADTRSYDIVNLSLSGAEQALPAEQLFTLTERLFLLANANGGRYTAADRLSAGFVQLEFPLGQRARAIGGARVERSDVTVVTQATDGSVATASPVNTDVLPSLSLTIDLGRDHQLRLAATQTLSRPEYRELSSVCYFEILGGLTSCGNPGLRRALIQNYDARWEWYPTGGEVISIGLFTKRFANPIERILVATTGATTAGYVNARSATNYGLEFDIRKSLSGLGDVFLPFSVGANATLMRSDISVGADSISSLTNDSRPMVGQSPYVVNATLGYVSRSGRLSATLLYNVVGRRITEAGINPLPDTYEEARNALDASLRYRLSSAMSLKFDARNLLDAPVRITQGAVTRQRYTVGRTLSAGFTWEP